MTLQPSHSMNKKPVLRSSCPRLLNLKVKLTSMTSLSTVYTLALLDSGAMGLFIDKKFCMKHKIETVPLEVLVPVHNLDGSQNDNGLITEEAHMLMCIGDHTESACLAVTNLGCQTVLIGHSWLQHHNLEVNWLTQKVTMT